MLILVISSFVVMFTKASYLGVQRGQETLEDMLQTSPGGTIVFWKRKLNC